MNAPQASAQGLGEAVLIDRYREVREQFLNLCQPLTADDYNLQAEAFTSPPKWHLAHTSWFFETFVLKPFCANYQVLNPHYEVLFNSYYNGVGEQFARPQRGLLSRPSLTEIIDYREHVDQAMLTLLADLPKDHRTAILLRTRLGIEHEQQHQELFFTDIKYSLSINPLKPQLLALSPELAGVHVAEHWLDFPGGLVTQGLKSQEDSQTGFCFDNEMPEHRVFIEPFSLANRLVSFSQYREFVDDGGYQRPEYWLSDGWSWLQRDAIECPLYWCRDGQRWLYYSLQGLVPLPETAAMCHINAYEADAYARWRGCRLPTESEWEYAAQYRSEQDRNKQDISEQDRGELEQLYGHRWQWSGSSYRPYPGFSPDQGAIGEYNAKFMCNQWVLRGSSCVTQKGHSRASYRNFFYPHERWQFSGLRLAKDIPSIISD